MIGNNVDKRQRPERSGLSGITERGKPDSSHPAMISTHQLPRIKSVQLTYRELYNTDKYILPSHNQLP